MTIDRPPLITFPFAVEYPMAHVGRLFAVRPEQARLELDSDRVRAVFGPWRVDTTLDNITHARVTGPYAAWKVAGPPHLSLADGGLTFATSTRQGLCLQFAEPIPGLLPLSMIRHGSLTVTVQHADHVCDVINRARVLERRTDDERETQERLARNAHDVLAGSTASELRAQAELRGIEHAASTSKSELVEQLSASAESPEGDDG